MPSSPSNKRKKNPARPFGFRKHREMRLVMPFHLAIPVADVPVAMQWYTDVLGCEVGRKDKATNGRVWTDLNFFGHQVVLHHSALAKTAADASNGVDGDEVPVPHFGICLPNKRSFDQLAKKVAASGKVKFVLAPKLRFVGTPGAQYTMFFKDPSNNALEFKAMKRAANLFRKF